MWKNGNTEKIAGWWAWGGASGAGVGPAATAPPAPLRIELKMLVRWLRCECIAPFGKPVVPDVYMIEARSSGPIATSGNDGWSANVARRSSQLTTGSGSSV